MTDSALPQISPRALRDAFGTFMTGVTVVTTKGSDGKPLGFTANSFASVSLDPPLLLVSIAKSSVNYMGFTQAKGFAVNVLAEGQKDISNTFARPVDDRFGAVFWRWGPYGAPLLAGVSAWFDCAMHNVIDAGDHTILIGHVQAFDANAVAGLGYCRGSYFTPALTSATVASGPAVVISALIERDGHVLLCDDGTGGLTLPTARVGKDGATATLNTLITGTGIQAAPGVIYAVYEDVAAAHQHIAFRCPATGGTPQQGVFVELAADTLADVTDQAMRAMLERLAAETRIGNYGVYFGTHEQGRVTGLSDRTTT